MSQVEHNFNFISWCILDEIWWGLQVVSCIKLMHFKNGNGITSLNLEVDSHNLQFSWKEWGEWQAKEEANPFFHSPFLNTSKRFHNRKLTSTTHINPMLMAHVACSNPLEKMYDRVTIFLGSTNHHQLQSGGLWHAF